MQDVILVYRNDTNDTGLNVRAKMIGSFVFALEQKFTRLIVKRKYSKVGMWRLKGFKCQNINCS